MKTLHFDGLFRGLPVKRRMEGNNAGFLSYGWLISRDTQLLARGHGVCARSRDATSNVAEYLALIEGLEALFDMGELHETIAVCGDARCIIDQMRGVSSVHSERIRPLYHRASRLAEHFDRLFWQWTPRRENRAADLLTRVAMRQARLDRGSYQQAVEAIDPQNAQNGKFLTLLDLRVYYPII